MLLVIRKSLICDGVNKRLVCRDSPDPGSNRKLGLIVLFQSKAYLNVKQILFYMYLCETEMN